ncbi:MULTISPECIES: dihydrofolate reductase family protein [Sphingobacterium]|uniref:Dihydrofolate reductase family protein n=1 Tax=Sphingobacterium populi TaxID=1812824 RepID=A0ABW5UA91_9SPHI|nr:dihydrofolate reductase family protein [Sphingobacterium sp. CFCC 11742]
MVDPYLNVIILFKIQKKEMERKIVCHMVSSVDGRLHPDRYTELYSNAEKDYSTQLYLEENKRLAMDAWIVGRASVAGLVEMDVSTNDRPEELDAFEDFAAERKDNKAVVVFDSKGSLKFIENTIMGDHIIVVLGKKVMASHVEYLRKKGISYIFAGDDGYDIELALEHLAQKFNLHTFALVCGGTINGSFLKTGLIDELYLQVYPGVDGMSGVSSIFEYRGDNEGEEPASGQKLELLDIDKKDHGVVYLRYRFHK